MAGFHVISLPTTPSFISCLLPFSPPSSCLAGTWHGQIRNSLKAAQDIPWQGPSVSTQDPQRLNPRGERASPISLHPGPASQLLLIPRGLIQPCCCSGCSLAFAALPSTRTQRLKIAALSQGDALPSEQCWHRVHPVPHPKPPPSPRPTPRSAAPYSEVVSGLGAKGLDPPGSPGSSQGGE